MKVLNNNLKWILLVLFLQPSAWAKMEIEECLQLYYGSQGEVNYSKAYNCFKENDDKNMVALMTFNGQGIEKDINLSKKMIQQSCKSCPNCYGHTSSLMQLIYKLSFENKTTEPILISDIVMSTVDINTDLNYQNQRRQFEQKSKMNKIISPLSEKAQDEFTELTKIANKYFDEESWWQTRNYRGGSIRSTFALTRKEELQENFYNLVMQMLQLKDIPSKTANDFKKTDQQLNDTYNQLVQKIKTQQDQSEALADKTELLKSQRLWIKYKNAWVNFFKKAYVTNSESKADDTQNYISNYLTQDRINELLYNPDCDNPQVDNKDLNCKPAKDSKISPTATEKSNSSQIDFLSKASGKEIFDSTIQKFGNPLSPNCSSVMAELKKAAEKKYPPAMNRYGACLLRASVKNKKEGYEWIKKAADLGDELAQSNLALQLFNEGNKEKAMQLAKEFQLNGNKSIGTLIYKMNPNAKNAIQDLDQAVQAGDPLGMIFKADLLSKDNSKLEDARQLIAQAMSLGWSDYSITEKIFRCDNR